jgi:hypothetical protein
MISLIKRVFVMIVMGLELLVKTQAPPLFAKTVGVFVLFATTIMRALIVFVTMLVAGAGQSKTSDRHFV